MLNFFFFPRLSLQILERQVCLLLHLKMPKMHLSKSSGMLSFIMRFRNFVGFQIQIRLNAFAKVDFPAPE